MGPYEGALQEHVHRFKYAGGRAVAEALGAVMGLLAAGDPEFAAAQSVVPVPLHRHRLQLRGYNQAELLARGVAWALELPLLSDALVRIQAGAVQSRLPQAQRHRNLRGVFRAARPSEVAGRHILLVDDVLTTGATADEAARVLLRAGAADVQVLCLAVGILERDWLSADDDVSKGGWPSASGSWREEFPRGAEN